MGAQRTYNVAIVVTNGTEILDFAGPYEVFYPAGSAEGISFDVFVISADGEPITCSGGLIVAPHYSITNHPPIDLLVVPGGGMRRTDPATEQLVSWLVEKQSSMELVTSVCTGAYLLGCAGLLKGLRATSHYGALEWLGEQFPDTEFVTDERVVDNGRIVTAAGVSAGIDMALHMVTRLCGEDEARAVATYMEYDWKQPASV